MKQSVSKEYKTIKLADVVPYWRNPRDNTFSVAIVKKSIEDFDYLNPILIDKKNIIIAGHTRYKALQQLGYEDIDVIQVDLPEAKAKAFRLVDNKSAELSSWTKDLILELKELGEGISELYFPEVNLDPLSNIQVSGVGETELSASGDRLEAQYQEADRERGERLLKMTCPYCYKSFSQTRAAVLENKEMEA